jgi:hypothetical protein
MSAKLAFKLGWQAEQRMFANIALLEREKKKG